MHNQSLAKARKIPGEAYLQPKPAKPRLGKTMHNHSPAKDRPRPGEAWAKPQASKGKTKTRRSLCITTVQKGQYEDQGSLSKSRGQKRQDKN